MDFDELDELDPVVLNPRDRDIAVAILGATGFTGSLMTEHLDAVLSLRKSSGPKWAIAGRNVAKLRNIASHCSTDPEIIQVTSDAQLAQLASRCEVVISAIGPYAVCGEAVIKACVDNSTHYIDVTGEIPWMHAMIAKYHATAKEKGSMIVLSAGSVSAVDEILCYSLVKKLGPLKSYREYFSQFGGVSGGTLQSTISTLSGSEEGRAIAKDPFCLGGKKASGRAGDQDCIAVEADAMYPSIFLSPAYNSSTGSRVVRRSSGLFEATDLDMFYGSEFSITIREGHLQQPLAQQQLQQFAAPDAASAASAAAAAAAAAAFAAAARERGEAPWPGQGPPEELRNSFGAEVLAMAESESGEWAHARWTSGCAYEVSAMAPVTGALVIVEELKADSGRGGVVTPAFAFHGTSWIEKLQSVPFANRGAQVCLELREGKIAEEALKQQISERNRKVMEGLSRKLKAWAPPALCESIV
ncbi:unnamed protein product [Effrenium voratum]|uniref:Saccharopine dehydrogenase NADP binding domain-containing protein n=1 Tax=Effrenium voratum TaxID=2562239 RepID=A0AA36NKF3_9DINO|nr:unnamed protein product [Effrenium voratum]